MKRTHKNLTYRQLQKENSLLFKSLSKTEQKELKSKGYLNRGWDNVIKSSNLLQDRNTQEDNVIDMFSYRVQTPEAELNNNLLSLSNARKNMEEIILDMDKFLAETEGL